MISENTGVRKALYYFSLVMVLVYIALGAALALSNFMIEMIPNNRVIIGGVLVVYGVFRMYILNRQRKSYTFFQQEKQKNAEAEQK